MKMPEIFRGFNKIVITGEVEEKGKFFLKKGISSLQTKIITRETWLDKKTNEYHVHTERFTVCFYSKLAEFGNINIKIGEIVYVIGRIRTKHWVDRDLNECQRTEVIADELKLIKREEDINFNIEGLKQEDRDDFNSNF